MKTPRILVVRGGAIGDFILTLPAISALRERWPEAHIEILGYPHIAELAVSPQAADATRSIDAKPLAGFFVPDGVLDPPLAAYFQSFNLVISYLFDPDEIFAGNVRRCGVKHLIQGAARPSALPAAVHYCKPLEALAIYVDAPQPRVWPDSATRKQAAEFLGKGRSAGAVVAIHPGSGSAKKNWPVEKFAAVARWAVDELAAQLLVVRGEADGRPVEQLLQLVAPRPVIVGVGLTLRELAAVLEQCALFVGNDSGITHLAAAVGTPTVALFGPASVAIWEPRGTQVAVIGFGPADVAEARDAAGRFWGMWRR